ncbi:Ribbon-helix-helix protein, copG family [Nostoc sp. PCC 7524]|uniref:CopG family transcriptional regulator n=1 Tax=Nostoc sp. (strain ATCC 29411 / PCC 7524) TaxID=28072 RepID=UPI00029F1217|nr:CopG family transcriptional regulator [Nostoc sp. PCC 7524]AFY47890.1 Ribbon-helix-helix protein, copG family [Nostoc sp. PCC 7524]
MTDTHGKVQLTLELTPELNQTLEELANTIGTTKSDVLRQAITLMQSIVTAKEETLTSTFSPPTLEALSELNPWTQNLIGVIRLDSENPEESYVNYLEEKYS